MEKPIITVEKLYCLPYHATCLTHYLYLIVLLSHKNICDELSEAFDNTLSYLSVFYRWTFPYITIFFQQSRIPSATFLIHYFHTSHPLTSDSPAGDIIKKEYICLSRIFYSPYKHKSNHAQKNSTTYCRITLHGLWRKTVIYFSENILSAINSSSVWV